MSIPGTATLNATRDYTHKHRSRHASDAYRVLGRTGFTVSKMGFGTYRCHQKNELHSQALQEALRMGCNIIDTSANYMDGYAESLIGDVLNQEIVWGELRRDGIVLVSKVGYIQGENLDRIQEREKSGRGFPEVVKFQAGLWHCIHPKFIEDQLTRSLSRLHIDCLDIYLLHDPEYFLLDTIKKGLFERQQIHQEFYDRLRCAFLKMEKLANEGLIGFYGISCNNLAVDASHDDFVSLASIWKAYEDVCREEGKGPDEGHFAVVQLPYNWLEHGAYSLKNNLYSGRSYSVLELAKKLGLGVLVNRPLNALHHKRLYRLVRYEFKEDVDYQKKLEDNFSQLQEMETFISEAIQMWDLDVLVQKKARLSELFQNVKKLRNLSVQLENLSQVNQIFIDYFIPLIQAGSKTLLENTPVGEKEKMKAALQGYINQLNFTARNMKAFIAQRSYRRVQPLENQFDRIHPALAKALSFSQKALLVACSTPGVDVVLNGMRTPEYVKDSMKVMDCERIAVDELLGQAIQEEDSSE